jgi:hypothetical protein
MALPNTMTKTIHPMWGPTFMPQSLCKKQLFVTKKFSSLTASKPRRNDTRPRLKSEIRMWGHSICELLLRATKHRSSMLTVSA